MKHIISAQLRREDPTFHKFLESQTSNRTSVLTSLDYNHVDDIIDKNLPQQHDFIALSICSSLDEKKICSKHKQEERTLSLWKGPCLYAYCLENRPSTEKKCIKLLLPLCWLYNCRKIEPSIGSLVTFTEKHV